MSRTKRSDTQQHGVPPPRTYSASSHHGQSAIKPARLAASPRCSILQLFRASTHPSSLSSWHPLFCNCHCFVPCIDIRPWPCQHPAALTCLPKNSSPADGSMFANGCVKRHNVWCMCACAGETCCNWKGDEEIKRVPWQTKAKNESEGSGARGVTCRRWFSPRGRICVSTLCCSLASTSACTGRSLPAA